MPDSALIALAQKALLLLVLCSAAPLMASLVVGVLIGVLQAATSIQDSTLSFLPKLLTVLVTVALFGPTILRLLVTFTQGLFTLIPVQAP